MKKIIGLISGIYILILLVASFLLYMPLKTREGKVLDINSIIPIANEKTFKNKGWSVVDFKSPAMNFRVAKKTGDIEAARKLVDYYIIDRMKHFPLTIKGEEWEYGYASWKKGYRLLVIFLHGEDIYWIELHTNSNASKYAKLFNNFLENMVIDGENTGREFADDLRKIKLPASIVMGEYQILLIMAVSFGFGIFILFIIFQIGWRLPSTIPHGIVKKEKTLVSIRRKGVNTNMPGVVLLGEGTIYIYSFGKKLLEKRIGEGMYIKGGYLTIEQEDGKIFVSISNPGEWRMWFPVRNK